MGSGSIIAVVLRGCKLLRDFPGGLSSEARPLPVVLTTKLITMKLLPDDINQAVGLIIQLKPDATPLTISNFGKADKYYFDMSTDTELYPRVDSRIRLHPITGENLIAMDQVHMLATMMGYEAIKEAFQVVGDGFDSAGFVFYT